LNKGDPTLQLKIGSIIFEILNSSNALSQKSVAHRSIKLRENVVIVIPQFIQDMCSKSRFYVSLKLPMIVKPKKYEYVEKNSIIECTKLGGYLTNDIDVTDDLIISKRTVDKNSFMTNKIIYDMVNNLSSIPYKINKEVFNFILEKGAEFKLLTEYADIEKNCKLDDGSFRSKYMENKYKSELSKYILERNILDIAHLYEQLHEFFFPVRLDQRGRVYCIPNYFNYQSNDLSKALLCFSKATELFREDEEAFEYLKIYGANCFGNSLDKKSSQSRIN